MINDLGQPMGEPILDWQPRPVPSAPTMSGRYCRLEPLEARHVAALHDALNLRDRSGRDRTYMPWGPFGEADEFAAFVEALVAEPGSLTLAIIDGRTGQPEGIAGWARIEPRSGRLKSGASSTAPTCSAPAATEAMYLMASHVFDELGYRRYEWKCDAPNARSMAAARPARCRPSPPSAVPRPGHEDGIQGRQLN